ERVRQGAVLSTLGLAAGIATLLAVVPAPQSFTAPGAVRAENYAVVYTGSEGEVAELAVPTGAAVARGTVLLRLRNPELDLEIAAAEAAAAEAEAMERSAHDS